jgi:broad specificity phosphatase PhoE
MGKNLRLYFIRHGITDWNKDNRVMGTGTDPLNESGREMVKELAIRLVPEKIPRIYTSTVVRALETAEILSREWGAEVVREPRLNESGYEDWVGKNYKQLRSDPQFILYREKPTSSRFSRNEGMRDIQSRILAAVERIESEMTSQPEKAAIVSHRDVIKTAIVHFLGMDLDHMHRLSISNASATLVKTGGGRESRLEYLNYAPWKR